MQYNIVVRRVYINNVIPCGTIMIYTENEVHFNNMLFIA